MSDPHIQIVWRLLLSRWLVKVYYFFRYTFHWWDHENHPCKVSDKNLKFRGKKSTLKMTLTIRSSDGQLVNVPDDVTVQQYRWSRRFCYYRFTDILESLWLHPLWRLSCHMPFGHGVIPLKTFGRSSLGRRGYFDHWNIQNTYIRKKLAKNSSH